MATSVLTFAIRHMLINNSELDFIRRWKDCKEENSIYFRRKDGKHNASFVPASNYFRMVGLFIILLRSQKKISSWIIFNYFAYCSAILFEWTMCPFSSSHFRLANHYHHFKDKKPIVKSYVNPDYKFSGWNKRSF